MKIIYRSRILFLLCTIIPFASFSQAFSDTAILIEKIFSRYTPQNPGCQLSISRNDEVIFSRAWGNADLENNVPLTTRSIIEAGSVSKQFTAAAILLLEQQGKLSVNDDVRKFIPELPNYGIVIRIKHLIHHTSGLKDWGSIAQMTGWARGTKAYRNEDALEIVARQKTLNNVPGAEFLYSNSNYNLLAIIVQRASGMSLAAFTREYIFIPAGMTQTQWRDNYKRIVPNRSIAYVKVDSGYEADMPNEYVYGNGGLLTTTEDLLKWNAWHFSGKFGNPSLLQKQTAVDTFNNKLINYYGAGLFIQSVGGIKVIRHTGATGSYRCYLGYYPELKLSIAWLSNTSQFDTSKYNVVGEVEKLFFRKKAPLLSKKDEPQTVPLEKIKVYSGRYRNERTANVIQLEIKDGQLFIDNRMPLKPVGVNVFKVQNDLLSFDKPDAFCWGNEDQDTVRYIRVEPADVSAATIGAYTGKYFSDETQSGLTVAQQNGTLLVQVNSYTSYDLKPIYKDAFRIVDADGVITFERNEKSKIVKMKISVSRARNVEFMKMD
ncbi:serine hydrolase domain-containing protein [Niastella vici]|nr:serine hydrolase domain-containing protein [Niastella vici]